MTTQPFSPPQQEFGTLRLQVSTALGAFPVPNAVIEVLTENGGALLYRGTTDQSGIADGLALPAKPREASQNAVTAPDSAARYIVNITHPAFVPQTHPVSLYTEIKTILPVVLIPILPNGRRS